MHRGSRDLHDAAHYRELAKKCRRLASQFMARNDSDRLGKMAEEYDARADRIEREAKPPNHELE